MTTPLPPTLLRALERAVGARHVVNDPEALVPFGRDETPNLVPSLPDVVVFPKDADEVHAVVTACAEAGVPIVPRGAGTGHSGGCVPVHGGVVLVTTRMNRILEIHKGDLTVDVEPGVVLGDLHAAVEEAGLFYPPDPASAQWCTLGGNIAENAGGPRALRYGVTRDYLLGLEAILPTSERIRVGRRTAKGVSGYDVTGLMCGSEGTLGIITRATLKLIPLPRGIATALLTFGSSADAARAVTAILLAGVLPRTVEYLDGSSLDALRSFGVGSVFPASARAALLVETDAADSDRALVDLTRAVEAVGPSVIEARVASEEPGRRALWSARKKLSEATRKIRGKKRAEDIVVPRSRIPEMVAATAALGEACGLQTCAYGHAGDGNLHVQILYRHDDELPRVDALAAQIFAQAVAFGGSLSGEHGIGSTKRAFFGLEHAPSSVALQRRIKDAFDPRGILNPGKIFPDG